MCATEEGSGSQYTEKKSSSTAGVVKRIIYLGLVWEGSPIHLYYNSFFSIVHIRAEQKACICG